MRVLVIDETLERREAVLESVGFGEFEFSSEWSAEAEPLALVFVEHGRARLGLTPPGVVEMVDGTVYTGALSTEASGDPEVVAWAHPRLGRLLIALEELRTLTLPGHARIEPTDADEDRVLYANGDSASGFVAEVGFSVVLESASGLVSTPSEYVWGLVLANEPAPGVGPRLMLSDGSVIDAPGLSVEDGSLSIDRVWAGEGERVSFDATHAMAYVPDASRLVALTSLKVVESRSQGTGLVRREPLDSGGDSALGAGDVLLPGVMTAAWRLPEGAARFSSVARLPIGSRAWGDCELVALAGGKELARVRLHAGVPEAELAFDLPAGSERLTLRIEAGAYGPVQDSVLLIEPMLRVDSVDGR